VRIYLLFLPLRFVYISRLLGIQRRMTSDSITGLITTIVLFQDTDSVVYLPISIIYIKSSQAFMHSMMNQLAMWKVPQVDPQ